MRIIHTADLHLGQILYQNYDRSDEHQHFFCQLERWCTDYQPDALVVSGDIYDIQQPSATTKKAFTDYFVSLHRRCPQMRIVIIAGNHDSASRIEADSAVWELVGTNLVGVPPTLDQVNVSDGSLDRFIIRLESGYIVALPYMLGDRQKQIQAILDHIAAENKSRLPVVMMGHVAVTGLDSKCYDLEIGKIKSIDVASFGSGYDYLALGHIHKPLTFGHPDDTFVAEVSYSAPVVRYSGSVLHVSCDETYPHSVSLVELDRHEGFVKINQLVIDELRHFYVLPQEGAFHSNEGALDAIKALAEKGEECYFRLRIDGSAYLPENFNQMVYEILATYDNRLRYNPKHIWEGVLEQPNDGGKPLIFAVADLQQMTDPMDFIEKTQSHYPDLDLEEVRQAFEEVKIEVARLAEEEQKKEMEKKKENKKAKATESETENNNEP